MSTHNICFSWRSKKEYAGYVNLYSFYQLIRLNTSGKALEYHLTL